MIIVAIDETNYERASEVIESLDPKKCMVKLIWEQLERPF